MNSQVKKQFVKNLAILFSAITLFTAAFQTPCKTWSYYEGEDKTNLRDAIWDNDKKEFSDLISKTKPNELEKLAYCFTTAIESSRFRICKTILEKNQNIINTAYSGKTPLCYAARWEIPKAIRFLLRHGADITGKSRGGNTALHEAALHRNYNVCKLLIKNGADVNARNDNGETPMHLAAFQNGNYSICRLLTMCGADFNATDNNGKKPIDLAWNDCKQPLINNQLCSQDGFKRYISENEIKTLTCPVCFDDEKTPDKFVCIYNCSRGQNGPCYEHAICQDCLKGLYLNNQADVCPVCKRGIAPHDAPR